MTPDGSKQTTAGSLGFTLVEVLISISLFAVAFTLLMGGFRFTSKAWDAGERVSRRSSELETVHRVFGNMLDRLFPVSLQSGNGRVCLLRQQERLRFSRNCRRIPGPADLYRSSSK